jgi:uncharacterized protein
MSWGDRLRKMAERKYVEQKHIDYWRAKRSEYQAQCKVWEQEAWAEAERAVALLRDRFGATNAIVFGSLVKDKFGEDSDIDLAVEGIEPASFFEALSAVNQYSQRWIDLKPMEALEPRFKERVIKTGRSLDEKPLRS